MDCPNKRRAAAGALTGDVLVEVLARVPARTLYRSKCVAKAWRDLIEDPIHRKNLPQTLQGFFAVQQKLSICDGLRMGSANLLARSASLQIDPNLSFLKKLPGIEKLTLSNSCNGLLLFENQSKSWPFHILGYFVCNPATEQWRAVPSYGPPPSSSVLHDTGGPVYLLFDPAISSHFHLVQFVWECKESEQVDIVVDDEEEEEEEVHDHEEELSLSVHVYSSETGQWIHIQSGWDRDVLQMWPCQCFIGSYWRPKFTVLNNTQHFMILIGDQIAAVDLQGVTQKIILVPRMAKLQPWTTPCFVVISQGHLHYISQTADAQLSIWVLEDDDTQ